MAIAVIDISNYAHRAYHAAYSEKSGVDAMPNEGGLYSEMIQMVYAFLAKDLEILRPSHVAIAVDFAVDSWRKKIFPNYKSSRSAPTPEWTRQIDFLINSLGALGLPSKFFATLEADDILGIISGMFPKEQVVLLTNDKDSYQLLELPNVQVFSPYERRMTTADDVLRKFYVEPRWIATYLAMVGDDVDDIPGLDKVGPKTIQKIVAGIENGTWESVEDWILKERKTPEKDLETYRTNLALAKISTDEQSASKYFPWPRLELSELLVQPANLERFRFYWTAKGKISSKLPRLYNLLQEREQSFGFDDE